MAEFRSKVKIFEDIESDINDESYLSFRTKKLRSMKNKLYTHTPTSDNPRFQQRVEKVEAALESEIIKRKDKCLLIIRIFSAVVAFVIGAINFLHPS